MEKEQSFGEKMQQSEEEFRKQFDPTAPQYHAGLQTPVPVGGARVPESMTTMYPEGYDPNAPEVVVDYGEDYKLVEANRQVYLNLKKSLAKLGPIVESFMRHQQIFKDKGDPNNQKHKQTFEQNIEKEKVALKGVQEELNSYVPTIEAFDAEGKEAAKELNEVNLESGKNYDTKETLGTYNFKVKKLSTKVFALAQKNMQKMKDIKKEYAKKEKEQKEKTEAEKNSGEKKEE